MDHLFYENIPIEKLTINLLQAKGGKHYKLNRIQYLVTSKK
jgi:hypothetical protein